MSKRTPTSEELTSWGELGDSRRKGCQEARDTLTKVAQKAGIDPDEYPTWAELAEALQPQEPISAPTPQPQPETAPEQAPQPVSRGRKPKLPDEYRREGELWPSEVDPEAVEEDEDEFSIVLTGTECGELREMLTRLAAIWAQSTTNKHREVEALEYAAMFDTRPPKDEEE